jgi:hypothetical protein
MMEAAIKAGGLKHPDDAKLHLGEAYAVAGKKQQAISTLKSVGGKEGTADWPVTSSWRSTSRRPESRLPDYRLATIKSVPCSGGGRFFCFLRVAV